MFTYFYEKKRKQTITRNTAMKLLQIVSKALVDLLRAYKFRKCNSLFVSIKEDPCRRQKCDVFLCKQTSAYCVNFLVPSDKMFVDKNDFFLQIHKTNSSLSTS